MSTITRPEVTPATATEPRRIGTRAGWTWVLLSSIGIAAFAVTPYLTSSLAALVESPTSGLAGNYVDRPWFIVVAFYAHIVMGGIALVLGPLQFWRGLRTRHPRVHRWTGRTYLVAVAISSVAGLVIAVVNDAGFVGFFGFGTLAVLWFVTGWRAYRAIRRRDIDSHRAWMMRNFALTYAAVMLRIWLPLLIVFQVLVPPAPGTDFEAVFANAYAVVPFLCWIPNLIVAEWLIRRRGLPSYRLSEATPVSRAPRTASAEVQPAR